MMFWLDLLIWWTVKKHLMKTFAVLGVETRTAATLKALEVLSSPWAQKGA